MWATNNGSPLPKQNPHFFIWAATTRKPTPSNIKPPSHSNFVPYFFMQNFGLFCLLFYPLLSVSSLLFHSPLFLFHLDSSIPITHIYFQDFCSRFQGCQ
ncbi:Uncharacterized protein TCM_026058 [Theobroma cacao]|uniref:Uncharacterized protein n=1 Tax=Theobroma cacao TaxID=3641 RepID=A0A061F0A4_THECC|nr:Uncharacterized protein TCM_026058 [Theobroma cacao]